MAKAHADFADVRGFRECARLDEAGGFPSIASLGGCKPKHDTDSTDATDLTDE
jgi:hypothetical protein